jgi:Uma2 family endonuclease
MATAAGTKTIADLHAMPDDGRRYELIAGEIVVAAAPSEAHMVVQTELQLILLPSERVHGRGKLFIAPHEVHLPTGDIVQPDLFFVTVARYAMRRGTHVDGAPDLVVEVISPSSRNRDLVEKRHIYETAGVLEYWIADPQVRTFAALTLRQGRYETIPPVGSVVQSIVLPDLVINRDVLFSELP